MAREVTEAMLCAGEGAHKKLLAKCLTIPSMDEELRAIFTAMDDAAPKPTVSPLCADVHKPTCAMMEAGEKLLDKRYNARSTASLEQAGLVYMAMERARVEALKPKAGLPQRWILELIDGKCVVFRWKHFAHTAQALNPGSVLRFLDAGEGVGSDAP